MVPRGHPARSWSVWAELGGICVVPILAGITCGVALRSCFNLVEVALILLAP